MKHLPSFHLVVLILGAIALLASCSNRRTAATLNDVESYIASRPDSALATLRAIDTTTLTTRALKAHYALLHAMALDKNWIDTTDVGVVMPAVSYYSRHNSPDRRAKAYYYLGRIQQNAKQFDEAGVSFLIAEELTAPSADDAFKALVYQAISDVYNQTHYYDEALRYSERSYLSSLAVGDTIGANASLFRMAQDLNNVRRFNESDSLFRLLIYQRQVHPNLRAPILCNYALNLVTRNEKFEQAATIFEDVLNAYGSFQNINYWGAYAYSLLSIGQQQKAIDIFTKLEAFDQKHDLYYKTWKSLADAYLKDYEAAYYLQKKASDIQNDNVQAVLRQSAVKAQKKFLEQTKTETERASRRRQAIAGCFSVLLIITMSLLFLFIKYRKDQVVQEKDLLLDTYMDLTKHHSALNTQYLDLSAQTERLEKEKASVRNQYIQMCQRYFAQIGRINEILSYFANDSDNNLYREIKKAIQKIRLDEQSQRDFETLLNDSFNNIMLHFRESYPNKKSKYYQLVSFLFAGFSAATICAIIPSYNKHNIYVEKSRLKRMIADSNAPDKEAFLKMLL